MRLATRPLLLLALTLMTFLPARAHAQGGTLQDCVTVPDTCCEAAPRFKAAAYAPFLNHPVAVVTMWADSTGSLGTPYVVEVMDLFNPPTDCPAPSNPGQLNWNDAKYHPAGWTTDSLGLVFGLTLDKFGNIYVTHTSCYNYPPSDNVGIGGPGAIYRIDALTGFVSVFAVLPNFQDAAVAGTNGVQESFPGLGNITYDCDHNQFFVSDLEDGKIYRLQSLNPNNASPATILSSFDHGVADPGSSSKGWAPLGERVWAVQWHGNRIYYGIWGQDTNTSNAIPNQIWSVGLGAGGAFIPTSDRLEITLPPMTGQNYSDPPSDISFAADGRMLIGEHGMYGPTSTYPHRARALEYTCQPGPAVFVWAPSGNTFDIGILSPSGPSCAGGVDYDRRPCLVWSTGDYLSSAYYLYGIQGMATSGGSPSTSLLIDANGAADYNKTQIGDVEVPCVDTTGGGISGQKYQDYNHNGIKNSGDTGLAGWTIRLTDASNSSTTTTTDGAGNYSFTGLAPGAYTLDEIGKPNWVQFGPTAPPYGKYTIALGSNQQILNKDFGNDSCGPDTCTKPPTGMVAWWPMDEPVLSPVVKDVVHLSPSFNVGTIYNLCSVQAGGKVGNRLQAGSGYAKVANHASLNFGTGDFTIDAWVNVAGSGVNPRGIVDKRVFVGPANRGYFLYLNGMVPTFEMGNGAITTSITAPAIPPNTWTHLAVTVHRAVGGLKIYTNGVLMTALNPIGGTVTAAGSLFMGQEDPAFGHNAPFEGSIDEVELFNRALDPLEIRKIWAAGSSGKCKEACYLPSITSFGPGQTVAATAMTLCNYNVFPVTYSWSLSPLPAGPGCDVAGPTVFTPASGSVTLSPGQCINVPFSIGRPTGLVPPLTACYQLTVFDSKGNCFACRGAVRGEKYTSWWWPIPDQPGVTAVPLAGTSPAGAVLSFTVKNVCPILADYPYMVTALAHDADGTQNAAIRLNGLPPGEPVIGTLSVAPNDSDKVTVSVDALVHDPFEFYEILLSADTDGDGTYEPVAAEGVATTDDPNNLLEVDPGVELATSMRIAASPNPFRSNVGIELAIAVAQNVRVSVYDVNGRLVRDVQNGRLGAGHYRFQWDGRNTGGNLVDGGIYFVRAQLLDRTLNTKVVRLK